MIKSRRVRFTVHIYKVFEIISTYELFVVKLEDVTSDTWEDNGILRNGMIRLWIRFACIGWG